DTEHSGRQKFCGRQRLRPAGHDMDCFCCARVGELSSTSCHRLRDRTRPRPEPKLPAPRMLIYTSARPLTKPRPQLIEFVCDPKPVQARNAVVIQSELRRKGKSHAIRRGPVDARPKIM